MAGLSFSDTTNKNGLLQDAEFMLNLGDAGITGDSSAQALPKVFTRLINKWLHRLVAFIFLSQDDWTWDDTSNAYYPIANRNMVATQQDYLFSAAAWGLLNPEGTTQTFTQNPTISNATPAVVTLANHGLSIGDAVKFSTTGALPAGITAGTVYYIISAGFTNSAFEIALTQGGTAINTTNAGSGTHTLVRGILPVRIQRVELSYDGGTTWKRANPLQINQQSDPTNSTSIANDFTVASPFYELRSGALWLYPIPQSASTNGIRVFFDRSASEFVSTDTVKMPPFDVNFHEILSIGASYDFATTKTLPQRDVLKTRLDERMAEFKLQYGKKDQDMQVNLLSSYSDIYGN